MSREPLIAGTTIRDDSTERHRRKYRSKNPMQRLVLDRFFDKVAAEIGALRPRDTLEFGCGEGFFLAKMKERGAATGETFGVDLREDAIAYARSHVDGVEFVSADIFQWPPEPRRFDLVVASEVMEHLPEPGKFLRRLAELCRGHLILTVPYEPWFRLMNLLRGRDVMRLGNHPEHIQQWNDRSFARFVGEHVVVERCYVSFPFVILVARPSGDRDTSA